MGGRPSRPSYQQWDMNELTRATGLPPQQIEVIYKEFMQAAGPDGQLDMSEFSRLYSHFPGAQQRDPQYMQQQIPRLFRTFDRDNSGALSFDEFLSSVVMMNRDMPRRDRIDYLIRQNNGNRPQHGHGHQHGHEHQHGQGHQQNDGRISAQYGHQVFRRLNDYYGVPPGTEHQCWQQVDRHNRGYVTHQELMDYVDQHEAYNRRY